VSQMPTGTGKTITLLSLITSYQLAHPEVRRNKASCAPAPAANHAPAAALDTGCQMVTVLRRCLPAADSTASWPPHPPPVAAGAVHVMIHHRARY
jgi:hypothetical protein